jgi:3'-phosphoadenosine 5'-phosphosulfate sulfotransferase (PAPS reductase)/FAD synthetase
MKNKKRTVCWFSCGAASAVAAKIAIKESDRETIVCYQDTSSEHPDNWRFLRDCEDWFGQEIHIIKSDKYKDIWDVFEKTKWLVGVGGARCTSELKRKLAEQFINYGHDMEVLGYTLEEKNRVEKFIKNNPERDLWPILIEKGLTKEDCLGMLDKANITIPKMYKLGYPNNNCVGCVKGGSGYWNKIRVDFPEVFNRMAKIERKLNVAINKSYASDGKRKRVFLDELDPKAGNMLKEPNISCGLFCMDEFAKLEECDDG